MVFYSLLLKFFDTSNHLVFACKTFLLCNAYIDGAAYSAVG